MFLRGIETDRVLVYCVRSRIDIRKETLKVSGFALQRAVKTSNVSITCCTRERQKPGQGYFVLSRATKNLFMLQVANLGLSVLCAFNY